MKTQMLTNVSRSFTRPSRSTTATRVASIAAFTLVLVGASAAQAQANLVVRVDGVVQSNNQEIVLPDTAVGETSQIVVVIRNEGNQTLGFTEDPPVMLAGGFPEHFEVIQPALETGSTLSPNGSSAFAVRFTPEFRFARLFTHVYLWTDASATPFHLIFSGRATGPDMFVHVGDVEIPDGGLLRFEDTEIGQTSTITLTIENLGDAELQLTGDPLAQVFGGFAFDFTVEQQPDATIAPNGSTEVRIKFAPTLERIYSTRLFINVNQDDQFVNTLYDIDIEALATGAADAGDGSGDDPNDAAGDDSGVQNDDQVNDQTGDQGDNAGDNSNDDQAGQIDGQNGQDANDAEQSDQFEEELDGMLPPAGMCGFGAGFASLMSMVSVGGAKLGRRRRRGAGGSSNR